MSHSKNSLANGEIIDAISRFLASPPEGTPAEIIEAFDLVSGKEFLPPKLFLETVEQAPVAISITDPTARILYVNSEFEQLTGYTREHVTGKNESVLSSNSTPPEVYQDLWATIQDGRVWQGTLVNHRMDHSEYLAELVISPVLNHKGRISYYLGMHRDITEMHQLEQRLKYQKELTEAALNAVPMVVALVGSDRKVLLDNHAYKALLGDFRGDEPAELLLEALEQEIGEELKNVCHAGEGFTNIEVRIDHPSGSSPRWFSISGVHVTELDVAAHNYFSAPSSARCCLLLIANEITDSRNRINEARLNMIRAGMAEQQMVETMREAISGAIFKLQVPLNVIKAALAMPGKEPDDGRLRGVLGEALESGDEAIENLYASLPISMTEQASAVNINEIVHEVLKLSTDKLLAEGVVVDWRPTAVLPMIPGRANSLRGLFKYLIDNAIQAVNESGSAYREIRMETRLDNDEVVVEVMDNGPGVPGNIRIKAFEPFFCGWKHGREHAGMGLTMAQEVAISHNGSVEIDPDFLGGCRLFVRLPIRNAIGE
ncbi:MAG: nitrogen fixation negative regulator NifL [Candidatus Sedimenticola sp. 6PFRAG7]